MQHPSRGRRTRPIDDDDIGHGATWAWKLPCYVQIVSRPSCWKCTRRPSTTLWCDCERLGLGQLAVGPGCLAAAELSEDDTTFVKNVASMPGPSPWGTLETAT